MNALKEAIKRKRMQEGQKAGVTIVIEGGEPEDEGSEMEETGLAPDVSDKPDMQDPAVQPLSAGAAAPMKDPRQALLEQIMEGDDNVNRGGGTSLGSKARMAMAKKIQGFKK